MNQLDYLLKQQGKTQKSLAEYLNVTPQAVSSYVKGKTQPDIRTLISIANFLEVSLDYLCDRPFNNNIGYIPDERKNTFKKLLELDNKDFEKIEGYVSALLDAKNN